MGLIEVASGRLGLSELAPRVVQSEIRAMTQECDRLGGVNLAQGVCDTEVPDVVAEGAIRAIREGSISIRGWMGLRGCVRRLRERWSGRWG